MRTWKLIVYTPSSSFWRRMCNKEIWWTKEERLPWFLIEWKRRKLRVKIIMYRWIWLQNLRLFQRRVDIVLSQVNSGSMTVRLIFKAKICNAKIFFNQLIVVKKLYCSCHTVSVVICQTVYKPFIFYDLFPSSSGELNYSKIWERNEIFISTAGGFCTV